MRVRLPSSGLNEVRIAPEDQGVPTSVVCMGWEFRAQKPDGLWTAWQKTIQSDLRLDRSYDVYEFRRPGG